MLVILSDIHDNVANLKKALTVCQEKNITIAICCGDVVNSDTLDYLAKKFDHLYLTAGNMELFDLDEPKQYKNITYFGRAGGVFQYQNKTIGLCHEPFRIEKLLARQPRPDIIFYGHTHQPWEEMRNSTRLINPGNVANTFYQPTFATYDPLTDNLELYLLNDLV